MAGEAVALPALPTAPAQDAAGRPAGPGEPGPPGQDATRPFQTILDAAVARRSLRQAVGWDHEGKLPGGAWLDQSRLAELKARWPEMAPRVFPGPVAAFSPESGERGRIDQTDRRQYDSDSQAQLWGPSACSATALVMMLHGYGKAGRITDAIAALGGSISPARGLLQRDALPRAGKQLGLNLTDQALSYDALQRLTAAGVPVMLDLTNARFPAGHWLVVTGADAAGVTVLDSSGYNLHRIDRAEFMAAWNGRGMFAAGPAGAPGTVMSGLPAADALPEARPALAPGPVPAAGLAATRQPEAVLDSARRGAAPRAEGDEAAVVGGTASRGPTTDRSPAAARAVAGGEGSVPVAPAGSPDAGSQLSDLPDRGRPSSDLPVTDAVRSSLPAMAGAVGVGGAAERSERSNSPSLTREERAAVIDQLVRSAHLYSAREGNGAHIRLQPDSLGGVDVRVVVAEGKVQLWMTIETEAARHAIQSSWVDLRHALRERGLDAQQLVLQSGAGVATFVGDGRGQDPRSRQQDTGAPGSVVAPTDTSATAESEIEASGLIDYRV